MSGGRRRVLVMFDRFGPYHVARMQGAAAHVDVIALEGNPASTTYAWKTPTLPDGIERAAFAAAQARPGVRRSVADIRDTLAPLGLDAVALPGWSGRLPLAMLRWARQARVPAIVMSESNGWDFRRRAAQERVKRGIVAHFAAGLVTSDSQAKYLADLGLKAGAIFRGYNAVDNDFFERAAADVASGPLPSSVAAIVPEAARGRYLLASNRFIAKKNLVRLLDAYAAFRRDRADDPADWPLVLLGDGELRGAIEQRRAALGLERFVHLPGFVQIDDLPDFYGTAGGFVHASTTEQWGLVVNEAMASGLPVAVSNRCGCAEILVDDGATGILFDPFDAAAITDALHRLVAAARDGRVVAAARERIAAWGPARFGAGLAAATEHAIAHPADPSALDRVLLRTAERLSR